MLILFVLVLVLVGSIPAEAQAATWELKSITSPEGDEGTLRGISCTSATFCIAVGQYFDAVGKKWGASGNKWNGSTWTEESVEANPGEKNGDLRAVSCVSTTVCRAAGAYGNSAGEGKSLIERLKEGKFTAIASPNPGSGILPGDGKNAEFMGISCPTSGFCLSTGEYLSTFGGGEAGATFASEWDSEEWLRLSPIENPGNRKNGQLWGTSCTSEGVCMSAGSWGREVGGVQFSQAGSESYNREAAKWEAVEAEEPATAKFGVFYGLSCTSTTFCMAVGRWSESVSSGPYRAMADIWNGTKWTLILSSGGVGVTKESAFRGVSCISAEECEAVGSYVTSEGVEKSLTYLWKSKKWEVQTTPNPTGAKSSSFNAISCTAVEVCNAVGGYLTAAGKLLPFAENL